MANPAASNADIVDGGPCPGVLNNGVCNVGILNSGTFNVGIGNSGGFNGGTGKTGILGLG